MSKPTLLPCAHCGGRKIKQTAIGGIYFIVCACGVRLSSRKNATEAATMWNRRVEDKTVVAIHEAVCLGLVAHVEGIMIGMGSSSLKAGLNHWKGTSARKLVVKLVKRAGLLPKVKNSFFITGDPKGYARMLKGVLKRKKAKAKHG